MIMTTMVNVKNLKLAYAAHFASVKLHIASIKVTSAGERICN